MFQGLSLEQAPPFSVPLRFFLTAPLMALLAGGLWLFAPTEQLGTRWSPVWLATTHLIVLGFMAMVMIGALFQMLPVVIGAPVARPRLFGGTVQVLWVAGVLSLANGFRWSVAELLTVGGVLLSLATVILVTVFLECFFRSRSAYATAVAMRWAVIALAIAVAVGLLLLGGHVGWWSLWRPLGTRLHIVWGLWGWVFLLIVGVSYQVIPMFYVTSPYPNWLKDLLAPLVVGMLALMSLVTWMEVQVGRPAYVAWSLALLIGGLALSCFSYAAITAARIRGRKRKIKDPTLRFWFLALGSASLAALGAVLFGLEGLVETFQSKTELTIGALAIWGGAVSVIQGMLFKIVPFLVWFHLHAQTTRHPTLLGKKVPHMKQILGDEVVRRQWWLHLGSLGIFVLSPWVHESLYHLGAGVVVAQALHQFWQLVRAARLEFKTRSQWEIEASAASK